MAITVIEGAMPGTGMTMFATYMAHRLRQYYAIQGCLSNLASHRYELDEVVFLKLLDNFNHKLYDTIWPWDEDVEPGGAMYLNLLRTNWRHWPKKPLECDIYYKGRKLGNV